MYGTGEPVKIAEVGMSSLLPDADSEAQDASID